MAGHGKNQKIYHITHLRNLPSIVEKGSLYSDAKRIESELDCEIVGMSEIKKRRLERLRVTCHPGTKVGEYVPFYFCPRSIMLYLLYMGNHPDLTYRGGQTSIIHLQADLMKVISWADQRHVRWAFSDGNAGTSFAQFYNSVDDLDKIDWEAIEARNFREPDVKEGKQAEFLVCDSFPWVLVEQIGVLDSGIMETVEEILAGAKLPAVSVERKWYF